MSVSRHLVSTAWLDKQLATETGKPVVLDASIYLQVVDVASGERAFVSGVDRFATDGHIAGARFADLFCEFSDMAASLPFTRPTAAQFAGAAGRLGVTEVTPVVIYDALAGQWASRLWWLFRSFGHEDVRVLDGGLRKWRSEGRPLVTGPSQCATATYQTRDDGLDTSLARMATTGDVAAVVEGRRKATLLCLLEPEDFRHGGPTRPRPGHIPGSVNLPFSRLLTPDGDTLRPAEELRRAFEQVTPLDGRLIITYCGGGIASTIGALALAELGYHNTMEYDGSLLAWTSDPTLPVSIG